jgi:hypothetical protein
MNSINLSTSRHREPANATVGTQTIRWQPYRNGNNLNLLRMAIQMLDSKVKNHAPCNTAFRALPGGRSFRNLLNNSRIWISFDPSGADGYYGATLGNDITISAFAFRMGIWTVAGTLVHELAHVNGATGTDTQAEDTLQDCLLPDVHNPAVIGLVSPGQQPALVRIVRKYA